MCDLCGTEEEKKAGRARAGRMADQLDRLASNYRDMQRGYYKPYAEDGKRTQLIATRVIRELVEEWI